MLSVYVSIGSLVAKILLKLIFEGRMYLKNTCCHVKVL